MEQMSFHKQKLYSLIVAGVGLISLLLPWVSLGFFGSINGFHGWGFLSLIGILGVVAACFMGDKTKVFDDTFKKVALASFAAMGLGALLFFLRISSSFLGGATGIGIWLCLIAGVVGVLWVMGIIKLPDTKKPPQP
jgi:hypothetical protein